MKLLRLFIGFFKTLISQHTSLKVQGEALEDIFNHLPINENLHTSGQPTVEQFHSIKAAGFKTIINLVPQNTENALSNEEEIVRGLGMDYVYIPVAPWNPTEDDFDQFATAMQNAKGERVWAHCAANARVSVFVYKYRCRMLGEDAEEIIWDVREIWEPFGVWKKFMLQ